MKLVLTALVVSPVVLRQTCNAAVFSFCLSQVFLVFTSVSKMHAQLIWIYWYSPEIHRCNKLQISVLLQGEAIEM